MDTVTSIRVHNETKEERASETTPESSVNQASRMSRGS